MKGDPKPTFLQKSCGNEHCIGITKEGIAYSWGKTNTLGQLGRDTSKQNCKLPGMISIPTKACKGYVSNGGSSASTGHTAILDENGLLWMAGCDRWQQLGLGSSKAGASGYTWTKLWQEQFVPSPFITELLNTNESANSSIRDISLGEDHTIILSSSKRNVYTFGKGGDGQLGLVGKPYVSAPIRSTILSEDKEDIHAVCAVKSCSVTIGKDGNVMKKVGKCKNEFVLQGIKDCIARAKRQKLIS